jgi:hypothetical protein
MITKPVTDDDFRDLLEWICCWETGPWVAGGSVRKVWSGNPWKAQDVDFFFRDPEQYEYFDDILPALDQNIKTYHNSQNAVTYLVQLRSGEEVKIQAIRKQFYPTIQAVLDDFDFNLAQFASDGIKMITTDAALDDIKNNRIRLNPQSTKKTNPLRVLKYAAYGFDPNPELFIEAAKNLAAGELYEHGY